LVPGTFFIPLKEERLSPQERVNIAVFVDFDNIEIGVRTTLNEHFDVGAVLEALKERGEVVTKVAYADWTRAGEYSRALTQHAIRLVQRNLTPGGDKNGADINLALDALEMAFTHPHINAYVIVGGDSDFLSLVEKLKQYDKKVFVVGGRAFTSVILQRNCHEFIAYENLMRKAAAKGGRPAHTGGSAPIEQAFSIVRRALKILADREVTPQTGLLKSTLLQLDSTFSERNYGASSFLDFAEKLAKAGLVQLKHSGRSTMVELSDKPVEDAEGASLDFARDALGDSRRTETAEGGADLKVRTTSEESHAPSNVVQAFRPGGEQPFRPTGEQASRSGGEQDHRPPVEVIGDAAEGVRVAGRIIAGAAGARWPMYLRNMKQILRAGGFDERRYGFGGLMDLLRACQKEGLIRMERDRRGGLRVFQGGQLARQSDANRATVEPSAERVAEVVESGEVDAVFEPVETSTPEFAPEFEDVEPQPTTIVDTTAEMLAQAAGKGKRGPRTARTSPRPSAPRKVAAARKPAAASGRRAPRGRKAES
jgi:uncharacterized protein (TIGR00288 family)